MASAWRGPPPVVTGEYRLGRRAARDRIVRADRGRARLVGRRRRSTTGSPSWPRLGRPPRQPSATGKRFIRFCGAPARRRGPYRRKVSGGDVGFTVDLVLPCLDEAQALPWVLGRVPAGVRAHRRRQRLDRRLGRHRRRRSARPSSASRARAMARPVTPGCPRPRPTSSPSWTRTAAWTPPTSPAARSAAGRGGRPGRRAPSGRRPRRPGPGTCGWPTSSWPGASGGAPGWPSGTSARRAPPDGSRCWGWESRTGAAATRSRRWCAQRTPGWRVATVDLPYLPRTGRSKVTGTPLGAARAVRDMSRVLAR